MQQMKHEIGLMVMSLWHFYVPCFQFQNERHTVSAWHGDSIIDNAIYVIHKTGSGERYLCTGIARQRLSILQPSRSFLRIRITSNDDSSGSFAHYLDLNIDADFIV